MPLQSARRRVAPGIASSTKSPLDNSRPSRSLYTAFPLSPLLFRRPSKKLRLAFSKETAYPRIWTMGPDAQPPLLSPTLFSRPRVLRVDQHVCVPTRIHTYICKRHRHRTSLRVSSLPSTRTMCLAAFSAMMPVRPPRRTYTSPVQRRGKQLSVLPDTRLHLSVDFRRRARKSELDAT